MQYIYQKLIFGLLLLAAFTPAHTQISMGGFPISFQPAFEAQYSGDNLKSNVLPPFPIDKVLQEDQRRSGARFAAPIQVDFSLQNAGQWTTFPNGDRLWRLKVHSAGALSLAFLYDDLYLPPGATLYMYNEERTQILGAYTTHSNTPDGTFLTGFLRGATAILEYYEPRAVRGQGRLHIFRVDHAYKSDETAKSLLNSFGFGASNPCNININCTQGTNWQKQKRGICRIIVVVEEGSGYCSGTLVNNTADDGKPYIISAFHCQDGFTPKYNFWRFDFNYETNGCTNPSSEPVFQSVLGSTLRSSRRENDFLLLELNASLPAGINTYFNGWSRNPTPPATSVSIHHPRGDIKKIAIENQAAVIFANSFPWSNGVVSPPEHLLRVRFDNSTVEVGSSGAPLFDPQGLIVGWLHGGVSLGDCNQTTAYYDRFTLAWEGGGAPENRLKDWLDPANTDVLALDGAEQRMDGMIAFGGFVRMENDKGIGGVNITLSGVMNTSTVTDSNGFYQFPNLPAGGVYGISLAKNYNDRNGISALDVALTSKHILSVQPLNSPLKIWAADVNNSKSVTTLDLIKMRRMILGLDMDLGAGIPSWRFVPEDYEFSNPMAPWNDFFPSFFHHPPSNQDVLDFNFTGVKIGDVNDSANANN